MNQFKELGISDEILRVIEEEGFKSPTDIQKRTIPQILQGKDLIGKSATGTGKTLAFACSVISDCKKNQGVQALILAPTRELAKQVGSEIKKYAKYTGLGVGVIFGGTNAKRDLNIIKSSEILIGTPGRIKDNLEKGSLYLNNLNVLVLDEADMLITTEFMEEIAEIINQCKDERQDLLFSATFPENVEKMALSYMKDPIVIQAKAKAIKKDKINQFFYLCENHEKLSLLIHFLNVNPIGLAIVFANRQESAKIIAKNIKMHTDYECEVLHSDIAQGKRNRILKDFKNQKFDILVTTDIASRGLDVMDVTHIFNYAIPADSKRYIHRIGRTARAGNEGTVINLVSKTDDKKFKEVIDIYKIRPIQKPLPNFKQLEKVKSLESKGNKYNQE